MPARVYASVSTDAWEQRVSPATHVSNLLKITHTTCPQHLDSNLQAIVFAFPHIRESTVGVQDGRWIVACCDLQ